MVKGAYTELMPSEETKDLIERADRIASNVGGERADARTRFDDALARLRRLSGSAEATRSGSRFEELVRRNLLNHEGWVVASEPKSAHASFRPDFLVRAGNRVVLVEAKTSAGSRHTLRHAAEELKQAVEAFGADGAYIVVPDDDRPEANDLPVEVLTLSELRELT